MNIFRVQDKDGRGPWKPGFSESWVIPRRDHDNLPPWYEEFGDISDQLFLFPHFGVGCRTIKQLRRWFSKKEYSHLRSLGYRAICLEPDTIIVESEIQCVFGRSIPLNTKISGIRLFP